ncbi:hypothetical protein QA596_11690 [Balneolales bacterium ANBcel1]|nr:hypothetical protein [Balneolales bacterium ANBcel1]
MIYRIVLILLLFAAGWLGYQLISERSAPLRHADGLEPEAAFMHDGEPVIHIITRLYREEHLDIEAINRKLPAPFRLLILDEDITANTSGNYVVVSTNNSVPELDPELAELGFTHTFQYLAVYEERRRALHPVLVISPDEIRDELGARLIDQVPADYGYALVMEEYVHDALYDYPVQLIEIVMLDEQGHGASDDIVIYWDPTESAFKATNTFGYP